MLTLLVVVAIMSFANGMAWAHFVSDPVLMFMGCTSTATVIALMAIIVWWYHDR